MKRFIERAYEDFMALKKYAFERTAKDYPDISAFIQLWCTSATIVYGPTPANRMGICCLSVGERKEAVPLHDEKNG